MELKVWVEGIQRIVCGVTVNTTCQDVVFALAHATGKIGRFTLIERWRNNERLLAPDENPLKLLLKWGEYANDVQFILQRSGNKQQQQQQQQQRNEVTGSQNSNNSNANLLNNKNTQANPVMSLKPLSINNTQNINNNNNYNNNMNTISRNNNTNSSNNSSNDSTFNVQQQHQQQQLQQNTNNQQPASSSSSSSIDYNFNTHHYDKTKELLKSFGAHDVKKSENVGIVKGIPQRSASNRQQQQPQPMQISPIPSSQEQQQQQQQQTAHLVPRHEKSHSNPIEMSSNTQKNNNRLLDNFAFNSNVNNNNNNNNIYHQLGAQNSKSINEINLAEVRNALDRRAASVNQADSMEIIFANLNNNNNNNNNNNINQNSNEQLIDIYNGNTKYNNPNSPDSQYKNAPTISANGALVPPPYRNPPPPRNSPLQQQQQQQQQQSHQAAAARNTNPFLNDIVEHIANDNDFEFQNYLTTAAVKGMNVVVGGGDESESIFQASQYSDLLQIIRYQREKLSAQQMELSKYDAEIGFLESKERDQVQELEAIAREISKADQVFRQGNEQLQSLQYVEEENELVKQQEKTLKSEIALLRSKLANCETELLQCKNKMRIIMDDIEMEQRDLTNKQKNNRQNVERDFLIEMERIQSEIEQAIHNTDTSNKTAENLKKEIHMIENAIADKKRQLEQLINEMKEVNLQSLTVTTSDEIRHLLEGSNKPGSSRRIIGSPRQLENAVPTSKNPHGVWV